MPHRRCSWLTSAARIGAAVGCCGLLLLAGCSSDPQGKRVTVKGKVTLDGQPLTGGVVYFHPLSDNGAPQSPTYRTTPVSKLAEDGSYTLSTNKKPGAPLGKYRVQLEIRGKSDSKQWHRLPAEYKTASSPLEVEVAENKPEGEYDLQLSSKNRRR